MDKILSGLYKERKTWEKPIITELECLNTFGGFTQVFEDSEGFHS